MSPIYKRLLKISRLVHLYLTLFGLALILFFSLSGFMLNNESWFSKKKSNENESSEDEQNTQRGKVDPKYLNLELEKPDPDHPERKGVDKFEVTESLRKDFQIRGAFDKERYREEDDRIEIYFVRPGQVVQVEIDRQTGETIVRTENEGWAGVMMDLHKGKYSGKLWSYVIDTLSVLLVIVSLTGLILWSSLKSRGKWGALTLFLGTALAFAIYYFAVP
jgi:hypothetical protein